MSTVILFNKPFGVLSQFTPESGHPALDTFGFRPECTLLAAWIMTAKAPCC